MIPLSVHALNELKSVHAMTLRKNLQSYTCLDASRPWLCYWTLHSMAILDALPSTDFLSRAVLFLGKCQVGDIPQDLCVIFANLCAWLCDSFLRGLSN